MNHLLFSALLALSPSLLASETLKQNLESKLSELKVNLMSPEELSKNGELIFREKIELKDYAKRVSQTAQDDKVYKAVAEEVMSSIESGILYDFAQFFEAKNFKKLDSVLSTPKSTPVTDFSKLAKQDFQMIDGIKFASAPQSSLKIKSQSINELKKNLDKYLSDFYQVSFVEAKILHRGPGEVHYGTNKLTAEVAFDIRGFDSKGLPIQKRSTQEITFARSSKKADWKIASIELTKHEHLAQTRKPTFSRPTANSGFDKAKTYPRLEALRRGGYALAIEDINQDGYLDAFVGNYGASTLWMGDKDGKFTQVEAPELSKVTLAKAASFVDFDNDGHKDLLITRFASDSFTGDVHVFKGNNGKFQEVPGAFPSNLLREYAMPLAVADYNNDGLLDVYIGFPGEKDFSMGSYDSNPSTGGKLVHGVFLNRGNLKFKDFTMSSIPENIRRNLYPHGSLATDYDKDGLMDIVVMDDQLNLSPVLKNLGESKFKQVNQEIQVLSQGYGMGVASGDLDGDGNPEILMSNATFNAEQRLRAKNEGNKHSRMLTSANLGIRFFKNLGDGSFIDRTLNSGLTDTGDGAGGVTLIDYDNDGLQDIYLVNGLWSGSSRRHNIDSLFAQAQYLDLTGLNHLQNGKGERKRGETQSTYMKILLEEKLKEDGKAASLSFGGHQANRLFKNLGNGKFIEVGHMEGVSSLSDGYMSVVADINRDGRADLVLRNCDVGSELNQFPVIETFINGHESKNSLWLSFEGTNSNRMGVGVKVDVQVNGKNQYREVSANNSASQGEVAAHIGLGDSKVADQVTVTWPSGFRETFKGLSAGRHHLKEGSATVAQN